MENKHKRKRELHTVFREHSVYVCVGGGGEEKEPEEICLTNGTMTNVTPGNRDINRRTKAT